MYEVWRKSLSWKLILHKYCCNSSLFKMWRLKRLSISFSSFNKSLDFQFECQSFALGWISIYVAINGRPAIILCEFYFNFAWEIGNIQIQIFVSELAPPCLAAVSSLGDSEADNHSRLYLKWSIPALSKQQSCQKLQSPAKTWSKVGIITGWEMIRWRNLPFKTLESSPPDVAYLIIIEVDSPHHPHSTKAGGV